MPKRSLPASDGHADLFGTITAPAVVPATQYPPITRRIVDSGGDIATNQPDRIDFLHAVLCQIGMPRSRTDERVYERWQGGVGLSIEAGRLGLDGQFVQQPLPYGVKPRLIMIHISSEAIRTQSPVVDLGHSMREFLDRLGLKSNAGRNGTLPMFKKQMMALAACRLTLAVTQGTLNRTVHTQPIDRFDAWLSPDGRQKSLWPGELELSDRFYQTLAGAAVPLDHRALAALKHSALALDCYTWLAHRLCRIKSTTGVNLSWNTLHDQFGQDYANPKDFRKEFRTALRQAAAVYPDAKLEELPTGLLLKQSKPPIARTQISVSSPIR
ncbi:MAG: replication protein RepA [Novosphingobium sp.]|uniref:replication protein RepA n=1 Tax=Novosphingobium sp. TaxID=1874826 RepID=UPI003B9C8814